MHPFHIKPLSRHRFFALHLLLTLLCSELSVAAAPPVYDVEIVVFKNKSLSDHGEIWDRPNPDAIRPSGFFPRDQFTELAADYYTLNNISRALEQSGQHVVLFHRAWRQLAYDKSNAIAYPIHSIAENGRDSVEGIVKLVRERFLHLDVNLQLMTARQGTQVKYSDSPNSKPAFELIETRRINSNVYHYFDHPRFGMIARVTPYIRKQAGMPDEEEDVQIPPADEGDTDPPVPADDQLTR